jgi:hypothetical protein
LPDIRRIGGLVFYRRVQGKKAGTGSLVEELPPVGEGPTGTLKTAAGA